MGTTLRELIYDIGGGIPDGRELKAVIPGGSSTPVLTRRRRSTRRSTRTALASRDDARLRRRDRDRRPRAAWCSSACGSRSSTCTSRAASARRAARARAGWCRSSSKIEDGHAPTRASSTCCSTSATASSASASARSATRPRCRSPSYVDKFRDEFQGAHRPRRLPLRRRVVARGPLRAGRTSTATHPTVEAAVVGARPSSSTVRSTSAQVAGAEGARARRDRAASRESRSPSSATSRASGRRSGPAACASSRSRGCRSCRPAAR